MVETAAGRYLTKLRGAAQGTGVLVAEVIVAELADALGLPVPRRALIDLEDGIPSVSRDEELVALLAASRGLNLGFRLLDGAREIRAEEVVSAPDDFALPVLWLDALVLNPDRTRRNPNVLLSGRGRWLVDHGASLRFQYDWRAVSEDSPRAPYPFPLHLFGNRAARLLEWDRRLAPRLSREVLARAVASVPDDFLRPLLPPGSAPQMLVRRRRAYEAFLWKRLKPPRPFVV